MSDLRPTCFNTPASFYQGALGQVTNLILASNRLCSMRLACGIAPVYWIFLYYSLEIFFFLEVPANQINNNTAISSVTRLGCRHSRLAISKLCCVHRAAGAR